MEITNFDDLLRVARAQPVPQRLLFVFAGATLPEDCTEAQRADFAAGHGGALAPIMSVDKSPDELASFAALAAEAREFGPDWDVVFVGGLSGSGGRPPTSVEADLALQRMIESIKRGALGAFIPFDRQGEPLQLN
jgi:hypothetical protein